MEDGLERWKSACWFWRVPIIMGARPQIMGARPHSERAPLNNGGAPSSCGRFGDFLLFFMQLRVDDFLDPLAVIHLFYSGWYIFYIVYIRFSDNLCRIINK